MIHVPALEIVAEVSQICTILRMNQSQLHANHNRMWPWWRTVEWDHTNMTWQVTNSISVNFIKKWALCCTAHAGTGELQVHIRHMTRERGNWRIISLYADVHRVSHARTNSIWPKKILIMLLLVFSWMGSNMSRPSMSLEDEFVRKVSGFGGNLRSCCLKKNKDIYVTLVSEQYMFTFRYGGQSQTYILAIALFINWSRNNLINPMPDISLSLKSSQKNLKCAEKCYSIYPQFKMKTEKIVLQ